MTGRRWPVTALAGPASRLHGADLVGEGRAVWRLEVDAPTLVLGSSQPDGDVDRSEASRLGVAVARRRSGGGAVLLVPGEHTWVDVALPRADPLWDDDVVRSSAWLGRAWAAALDGLGLGPAAAHGGPWARTAVAGVVCFAALGPGEVVVGGAKVVGLSQRRTRAGARLQTVALHRWDPDLHARLLAPGLARAGVPGEAVAGLAVAGVAAAGTDLVDALTAALPGG